ncbi:transglutaminase-like domain-containing protein [Phytohabitans sp. LJ34]|uniref:transglutaminase-like domain-containing protein n=1 Tax=Phytohabitans sp. LJ34 TaxID=3452217 RepID=UPI003F898E65
MPALFRASGPTTDAADMLLAGQGVCRDYAHLVATLCRAIGVPARVAAVYAAGLDPMGFHLVTETALDGRWWVWHPRTGRADDHRHHRRRPTTRRLHLAGRTAHLNFLGLLRPPPPAASTSARAHGTLKHCDTSMADRRTRPHPGDRAVWMCRR